MVAILLFNNLEKAVRFLLQSCSPPLLFLRPARALRLLRPSSLDLLRPPMCQNAQRRACCAVQQSLQCKMSCILPLLLLLAMSRRHLHRHLLRHRSHLLAVPFLVNPIPLLLLHPRALQRRRRRMSLQWHTMVLLHASLRSPASTMLSTHAIQLRPPSRLMPASERRVLSRSRVHPASPPQRPSSLACRLNASPTRRPSSALRPPFAWMRHLRRVAICGLPQLTVRLLPRLIRLLSLPRLPVRVGHSPSNTPISLTSSLIFATASMRA